MSAVSHTRFDHCVLLAACRNADTLAKLQAAEKALKEEQESAYVDMAKSNEEKEAGNAAFKEQK